MSFIVLRNLYIKTRQRLLVLLNSSSLAKDRAGTVELLKDSAYDCQNITYKVLNKSALRKIDIKKNACSGKKTNLVKVPVVTTSFFLF